MYLAQLGEVTKPRSGCGRHTAGSDMRYDGRRLISRLVKRDQKVRWDLSGLNLRFAGSYLREEKVSKDCNDWDFFLLILTTRMLFGVLHVDLGGYSKRMAYSTWIQN
jgi:hypothetical protein